MTGHLPPCARRVEGGLELRVKVVPGASRDQIAGLLGDRLKIRTATAPEGGKANKAVAGLIAKWAGIPPRDVEQTSGPTNPEKAFFLRGIRELPLL